MKDLRNINKVKQFNLSGDPVNKNLRFKLIEIKKKEVKQKSLFNF